MKISSIAELIDKPLIVPTVITMDELEVCILIWKNMLSDYNRIISFTHIGCKAVKICLGWMLHLLDRRDGNGVE